ncbi:beta-1,3-galactosyltransferase 1-like [Styela clava]
MRGNNDASSFMWNRRMSILKVLIGILLSANMFYFVLRYRELSNTVRILQEQQRLNNKVIRTVEKEKEPEKPKEEEPQLDYSQKKYYPFLYNEPNKCKNENGEELPIFLLIIVKSTTAQFDRRRAIRATWGNETLFKGLNMRRIFLLAKGNDEKKQALLEMEQNEYHDIIQGDFQDSFRNLTIKDIMFMRWMTTYCPQVKYIFKGDDDVFVNLGNIVDYLLSLSSEDGKGLFTGSVLYPSPRIKDPKSKYYVPVSLWPEKYYPPYVSGGGFLMSSVVAKKIFEVSKVTPIIPIDDAFLGVCLRKLGMKPQNHKGFKSWGVNRPKDICIYREIMTLHKLGSDDMIAMWKELHNSNFTNCAKTFEAKKEKR